jgi:hypothetical protein
VTGAAVASGRSSPVDRQHDAGQVGGLGVGEKQRGACQLAWHGTAADRDLSVKEVADLRVIVDAVVERRAKLAGGERVDRDLTQRLARL